MKSSTLATIVESPFANLTTVCFFKLCAHLSINDLLVCAHVNRHWRMEVASYCRTIHSLVVVSPASTVPQTRDAFYRAEAERPYQLKADLQRNAQSQLPHQLMCRHLSAPFSSHLAHLFPHLQQLSFQFDIDVTGDTLYGLLHLLYSYQSHLTLLSIDIRQLLVAKFAVRALFSQINQLKHLQRLSLKFGFRLGINIKLRALGWLHELTFFCIERRDILCDSFHRYALQNPRLTVIRYKCDYLEDSVRRFTATPQGRDLARRMAEIAYFPLMTDLDLFPNAATYHLFVSCFSNLTHLRIHMDVNEWHGVLRQLQPLAQLADFRILLDPKQLVEQDWRDLAQAEVDLPFQSVETLVLSNCAIECHDKLALLRLGNYFPRLCLFQFNWLWPLFDDSVNDSLPSYNKQPLCMTCFPFNNVNNGNGDVNFDAIDISGAQLNPDVIELEAERIKSRFFSDHQMKQREEFRQCARVLLAPWKDSPTLKFAAINDELVKLIQLFQEN